MTINHVLAIELYDCYSCGAPIALTESHERSLRRSHDNFYCPNGHSQCFPHETVEEKLRKERDNALSRANRLSTLLEDERTQHRTTEMRLRGTKGVLARTKRRIAEGACPRCHKRFPDLKAHIEHDHPDYAPALA